MSSQYTVETGEGYQSIHSAAKGRATISLATVDHIDWSVGDMIVATPHADGVVLQPADAADQEALGEYRVCNQGHGPNVSVGRTAIRELGDVEEVRVYAHAANALLVVDADDDPRIMADGSGLQRETYVGVDDLLELAQEQADDHDILYHIRQARSLNNVRGEADE